MASPFARFRKRQKIYLALLGRDVHDRLRVRRRHLLQRLGARVRHESRRGQHQVRRAARVRPGRHADQPGPGEPLPDEHRGSIGGKDLRRSSNFPPQFRNQLLQFRDRDDWNKKDCSPMSSETAAVDAMILANKAEELGVVVSDDAINDFIRQRTNNQLTREEIAAEISRLNVSRNATLRRPADAAPVGPHAEPVWPRADGRPAGPAMGVLPATQSPGEGGDRAGLRGQLRRPGARSVGRRRCGSSSRRTRTASRSPARRSRASSSRTRWPCSTSRRSTTSSTTRRPSPTRKSQQHYEKNKKNYPYTDPPLETPRRADREARGGKACGGKACRSAGKRPKENPERRRSRGRRVRRTGRRGRAGDCSAA